VVRWKGGILGTSVIDPPFLHLAEYAIRYDDDYIQFIEDVDRAKQQLAHIPPLEDDDKPSSINELWKRPVHLITAIGSKGKEFDRANFRF